MASDQYNPKFKERSHPMANKFLPFVVESSTPHNVFKTLISRSKGMNRALIASVFNLTLNVPIKELRDVANKMEEMQLDQLYEELLQKYDIYRIDTVILQYFTDIETYFPNKQWYAPDKLKDFDIKDIMMFFCVFTISNKGSSEYSSIDLSEIYEHENIIEGFNNYVQFADNGELMKFKSSHDLKTYIIYRAILHEQMEPENTVGPICAVYTIR